MDPCHRYVADRCRLYSGCGFSGLLARTSAADLDRGHLRRHEIFLAHRRRGARRRDVLLAAVRRAAWCARPRIPALRIGNWAGAMDQFTTAVSMLFTTSVVPAALGGLVWGILGGATPGLSASITMALLLPFTYTM